MNTLARVNTMPTLFDTFFGPSLANRPYVVNYRKPASTGPAVNVKETDTHFVLEVAAPGAQKEQFTLNVTQQVLTLALKNEQATEEANAGYVRKEFGFQAFERSFRLPKNVDANAIKATYEAGILTVELPKVEEKQPEVKQIEIA
ncbi:Hsp20/alpha crystallin family protein [Fibrella sp. HMF5335]|uniref:Hsp20/alpha crystallin family protein n=1 Tax=Fibrella rubiginis TaxID=2817060 RepID=A0A939GG73_9BACT|nr:Hsp20/alpha crystallin family protein [Fibrella rubiginis]MBO0936210.1 Hsp20/alpha crystallin family protein [Fibrella rubiginis]